MNPLVVQGAAQLLLGKYKSQKGLFVKNILTMAATGLVIFAGLGWYLDWYKVARTTTPDGKQNYVINVDTKRIESDLAKGTGYLQNFTGGNVLAPTPSAPVPNLPFPQPYPAPQQPASPPSSFPSQSPWLPAAPMVPAAPVNPPNTGGFVFPGQQTVPPVQIIPGRPF